MCECNCADINGDHVFKIGDTTIVVDAYYGCEGCDEGPATLIHFLDKELAEDFDYLKPEPVPLMLAVEFVGLEDLVAAAKELDNDIEAPTIDEFDSYADFIEAYGLRLLERAFRLKRERQ